MRHRSAFAYESRLARILSSGVDKNKCHLLKAFKATAGMTAGTFAMPGRNLSVGLRWQK